MEDNNDKFYTPTDKESIAALNYQDTKNLITKRDREPLHEEKAKNGYVSWFLSL